jgi:hypothetical protein
MTAGRLTKLAPKSSGTDEYGNTSKHECESILRLVQSQLDSTIRRRLEGA